LDIGLKLLLWCIAFVTGKKQQTKKWEK